jgi:hypothetical protein
MAYSTLKNIALALILAAFALDLAFGGLRELSKIPFSSRYRTADQDFVTLWIGQ